MRLDSAENRNDLFRRMNSPPILQNSSKFQTFSVIGQGIVVGGRELKIPCD